MVFKRLKKALQLGAIAGALALPMKSQATDFYNVRLDLEDTNSVHLGGVEFYGGHYGVATDGYDDSPYDISTDIVSEIPPSSSKVVAYTEVEDYILSKEIRQIDSTTPHKIKGRYRSNLGDFQGRSTMEFNFRNNTTQVEYINPQMFYWGEFILPAEFSTNGVQQVDKKAMLSNFDTNRNVYFNLEGIHAVHNDDFAEFNVYRTPNSLYFSQPSQGSVAVSNLTSSSSITNAQRFNYADMTNSTFRVNVNANSGRHLKGLELVLQDVRTGDFKTNSLSFPTNSGDYVSNFSTNLAGLAGSNVVRNVQTEESLTTNKTPYLWYVDRGVTNDFETIDTTDFNGDGFTGRDKYIMNADNLTNSADYFDKIFIEMSNGVPRVSIPNTKADRKYTIEGTSSLNPLNWQQKTNSLGNGGTKVYEMQQDTNGTWFYRGKVGLVE